MRKTKPTAGQLALFVFTDTQEPPPLLPLEPVKFIPSASKPATPAGFVVSNSDEILVAGSKGKVRANLDAIRLLYQLERTGREPDAEEQKVLARYAAFGGLAKVFDPHGEETTLYEEIKALLTPEDYKHVRAATTNAFYTSPEIIKAMWTYLAQLGFTGGRVLEPAAATGLFFAGMPEDLRKVSELTAVELDSVSGRIGAMLHPDALYHIKGFEEAELVDGYFDLIISNVPFGDYPLFDQTFSKEELALSRSIHNYYFVKATRLVRPGGLVAFITSRWTMDSKGAEVRTYLEEHFKLLGAVRLPSNAFRAFAGTDVVTDIIFLQKYAEGESVNATPPWLESEKVTLQGPRGLEDFWINRYFERGASNVLGVFKARTGPFSALLEVDGDVDMEHMAERILTALPAYTEPVYQTYQHKTSARVTEPIPFTDVRKGSYGYMVVGGIRTVYQRKGYEAVPLKKPVRTLDRICGLVDLVAIARNVLHQCLHGTDAELAEAQAQLNEVYTAFVKEFGFINSKNNRQAFTEDPNAPFLRALEHYSVATNTATKARIFTERTIKPQSVPQQATSALDALLLSLNQKGGVNMPYMTELYGKTETEIVTELGDKLYHDPLNGWCTKDEYLSGNVVTKLIEARLAASADPGYARNVTDLEAVQPVRLTAQEITASLGATWIPKPILQQFVMELVDPRSKANHLDDPNHPSTWRGKHSDHPYWRASVTYTPSLGQWTISQSYKLDNLLTDRTWGTGRRSAFRLTEALLNGSQISIWDKDSRTDQMVFNAEETLAAREKANEISRLFRRWVWVDPDRSRELVDLYNDTFRCMVERSYDGEYLNIPNTSTELPPLHKHQRDAIARAIQGGNLLLWHLVGSGKTRVMIISAMEMKRLGLRNKPIHVVPNHLLEQYAHEFYLVYPNANVLVVDSAHMSPSEKQETLAKIATEDWDSILINHSAFQRIPLSVETWEWLIQDEIDELDRQIEDLKEDSDQKFTVKRMESKKKRLEERLESKRAAQNYDQGGLHFEQLGLDTIVYDECFPWETRILTDQGWLPIGQVVDNKMQVKVLSKNMETEDMEWKPVVRWLKRDGNKQLVKVVHDQGEFICTEDHKIWVQGRGYVKAQELCQTDQVCLLPETLRPAKQPSTILQRSMPRDVLGGGTAEGTGNSELSRMPQVIYQANGQSDILQRDLSGASTRDGRTNLRLLRQDLYGKPDQTIRRLQSLLLGHLSTSRAQSMGCQDMPAMSAAFQIQVNGQECRREKDILLDPLFGALADESSEKTSLRRQAWTQYTKNTGGAQGQFGANEAEQSYQTTGSTGKATSSHEGQNFSQSGWELTDYAPAAHVSRSASPGRVYGVSNPDAYRQDAVRVSTEQLQGGYCQSPTQAGNRSGWEQSQDHQVEILRQAQGSGLICARVVRVEILESRSNGESGDVRAESPAVYDLEVADNHNFFAEGVLVSNCHTAKNLYYSTNRDHIAGIGGSDSGVAFDLFIKVQYLTRRCMNGHLLGSHAQCSCGAERAPAGAFIGATGTAITNSIAEAFTWKRFFAMDLLIEQKIEQFDAWASMYGDTETCIEMHPSGKWVAKERFIRFNNVPELMALFKQFADIQIDPQTLGLKRPQLYTGAPIAHEIQPSEDLQAVMAQCARRADNLKNVKPWEDNMLAIMHTATAAATDVRLVNINVDHPDSKVNLLVQNVFSIWQRTSAVCLPGLTEPVGLTQLIFLDIGVPGGSTFNLYQDIKDKLVRLGVPAEQIAFAQDAETDLQKKQLYNDMNEGRIRITLATTARFGTGVNAQRLLYAVHHPDAPWTPALMEQRDGRILRQGNLNEYIYIMRYIVARSLDHHKWHLLTLKADANRQLFTVESGKRSVEDLEMAVISFSQMRALATGDPLLMEKVKVEADLTKLYILYDKWYKEHRDAQNEYVGIDSRIQNARTFATERQRAAEYRKKFADKAAWWKVQGRRYTERADAGNHLGVLLKNKLNDPEALELPYAKVGIRPNAFKVMWAIIQVDGCEIACELGDSGSGALTRIDNCIDELAGQAKFYQHKEGELIERKAQLEEYIKHGFDRQTELDQLQQALRAIEDQLADKARGLEQPTE